MSKAVLFILLQLAIFNASSQILPANFNLVPNPGFEFNTSGSVVSDTDFANNPICWAKANQVAYPFITASTPASYPHGGFTFGGIITGYPVLNLNTGIWIDTFAFRTYYQSRLYEPLISGKTYYFSIFVGVARNNILDVLDNVGVYFSQSKISDYNNFGRINVTPQIRLTNWSTPSSQPFSWVKLTASYTATGGEQYLTFGNFDTGEQLNHAYLTDSSRIHRLSNSPSYLYFDDISLLSDTINTAITLTAFNLGNDTTVCPRQAVRLGGQPNFFHYWWNTGDTIRFITTTQPGTYWCTVDFGCSNYTDTINITTTEDPVNFNLPDTVLCSGRNFLAKAPTGNYTYHWSTGATAPSITLNNPGTYWAILSNTCGSSHTDTFTLTSTPSIIPGININTIPPTSLCAGTPITFITNDVAAGNTPTFQWYKNGTLIAGATSRTYTDAGLADKDTLTIALYSSEACPVIQPTMSNKVGVTVSPVLPTSVSIIANPSGNINPGQPVIFTATPVNGGTQATYSWMVNSRQVPGSYGPTFTATNLKEGDVVAVRLESSEPCPQPALVYSNSMTIHTASTSIISIGKGTLSVYPNPVTDYLTISFSELPKDASFYLFDGMGRAVIRMLEVTGKEHRINLQGLASGVYTYNIVLEGEVYRGKVLKR